MKNAISQKYHEIIRRFDANITHRVKELKEEVKHI